VTHPLGGGRLLYGIGQARAAIAREGAALVVPDFPSVIAWHRVGVQTAVAPASAGLTVDQVATLARFGSRAVVVSPDQDTTQELLTNPPTVRGIDLYVAESYRRTGGPGLTRDEAVRVARGAVPFPEARMGAALDSYRDAPTPTERRSIMAAAVWIEVKTAWGLAADQAEIDALTALSATCNTP